MAWSRTDDGGFAYNEGSLNFTLRGSAFYDSNGDGVPDGVTFENGEELSLMREKVGFPQGNDRTNPAAYKKVAENQFTYNEGSLNYTLTDGAFHDNDNNGNPDNGYELVVPEVQGKLGWSKNADGVEVKTIIIGRETGDGHRRTKIGIDGLHGEVFLNHPEAIHSFGVKGDGNGDYNFTGSGRFKLNDDFIMMHGGERELKVQIKNGKIKSIDGFTDEDVIKVSASGNIRINGKKITVTANQDMDMYGKPARTSGGDSSGDSSDTADSGDSAKVAGETEELTKIKNDLEYKSSDDAETKVADFTITAKNLEYNDAVTAELVQKFTGADKQDDTSTDEINLNAQQPDINGNENFPAENQINSDLPKISNVQPAANEIPADDGREIAFEIPDDLIKEAVGLAVDAA